MIHLFIINPAAGKRDRTEEFTKTIEECAARHGLEYRIAVSKGPGDCRAIAREAAESGEEYRIYACGGDGTLNEVVSGVRGHSNVAVTNFSAGSGNDFVKIFGATEPFRDLEQLLDCEETEFDLIRCNDDVSLNIASVGFDARIGTEMAAYKRLPLVSGPMAYLISALVNLIKGVTEHYVVEIDGEKIESNHTLICACNGQYYGGGFHPVPEADPCDGKLDVLLVGPVTRLKVLSVIGIYKKGQYTKLPQYIRHIRTDAVKIICDKPTPVNLDGELRTAQTVDIRMAGEKLRFFYPKSLNWSKRTAALAK